jgi:uncharacterized membrane protein YeaQ/YmgE (transglycosylase-associated protein family)
MSIDLGSLIVFLIVGIAAGWLAGRIVRGGGFGLLGDLIVGVLGAIIGGWLLGRLNLPLGPPILGAFIDAVIGAVILLIIVRFVSRRAA